jgi:hypothetical protein
MRFPCRILGYSEWLIFIEWGVSPLKRDLISSAQKFELELLRLLALNGLHNTSFE